MVHGSALKLVGSGWSCHHLLDWDMPRGLCSSPPAPGHGLCSPCAGALPMGRGLEPLYKQRLAAGQAGAPRALAKAAPALGKTQRSLNKSLWGLLSLCFKDVTERCLHAVTNCYLHVNLQWCVVPVAVVFKVQCQAPHRRTVLLPMLLCASFLSAHSHVPHLLKNQSFLAFSHFRKLFSTPKKRSQFTHHCSNSMCKLWVLIRGGLARPRKDSWRNERWFPAEMPVRAGWD